MIANITIGDEHEQMRDIHHNRQHHSSIGVTYHFGQTTDGQWIHWMSGTVGGEKQEKMLDRGDTLTLEPITLSIQTIQNEILDKAQTLVEDGEREEWDDEDIEGSRYLLENSHELASDLRDEWEWAVTEVLGNHVMEGICGVTSATVWTGTTEIGWNEEVKLVMADHDVHDGFGVFDALYAALVAGVREEQMWMKPRMGHEAKIIIE